MDAGRVNIILTGRIIMLRWKSKARSPHFILTREACYSYITARTCRILSYICQIKKELDSKLADSSEITVL